MPHHLPFYHNNPYIAEADNTRVTIPNPNIEIEEEEQNYHNRRTYLNPAGPEKTLWEKIKNAGANPLATFGYSVRGEDIPWGNVPRHENAFDTYAVGMVNPFAWLESAEASKEEFKQGNLLSGSLEALGVVPAIPSSISATKKLLPKILPNASKLKNVKHTPKMDPSLGPNRIPSYKDVFQKNKDYLISEEYIKLRTTNTGESREHVVKKIKEYLEEAKKTAVKQSSTESKWLSHNDEKTAAWYKRSANEIRLSDEIDEIDQLLGNLDHETKHLLSPASKPNVPAKGKNPHEEFLWTESKGKSLTAKESNAVTSSDDIRFAGENPKHTEWASKYGEKGAEAGYSYDKATKVSTWEGAYKNYPKIEINKGHKMHEYLMRPQEQQVRMLRYKEILKAHGWDGTKKGLTNDIINSTTGSHIKGKPMLGIARASDGKYLPNDVTQLLGNMEGATVGSKKWYEMIKKTMPYAWGTVPVAATTYSDGTNVTSETLPLTSFQAQETPYQDLNWLQKANYGFSENMYNKPLIGGGGLELGVAGKLNKTNKLINTIVDNTPKTVSSDSALNAQINRQNLIAEQTGNTTTTGSLGIGNGMYMEADVFEDGGLINKYQEPIDYEKLYKAIEAREHLGYLGTENYSPYIRTKGTKGQRAGTEKGSSAYGPIQITTSRLEDLNTFGRRRHYWDDPTADNPEDGGVSWDQSYVDQLKDQAALFFKYGGIDYPEGGIDPTTGEDISRYNYKGSGDLSGEEYHQKYKDLSTVLLKGTYNMLKEDLGREPSLEELVKHWRGGVKDEEPEYITDVVNYYNTNEFPQNKKVKVNESEKESNYKQGGTVYANKDAATSRYMKSFRKFNDGGKVGNTTENQLTGFVKDRLPYIPDGISPLSDMEMIFQEKYNTELSEEEMDSFLLWATNWKNPVTGEKVNMMDEGAYDVRGFWKSGDWKATDSRGHGSDKWKKPNHPTFSDESVYSKQKGGSDYDGGEWMDNGAFLPGFHNMHDNERLLWEFSRDEGPEHLIGGYILPEVTVTP